MKVLLKYIPAHIFVLYSAGVLFQYVFSLNTSLFVLCCVILLCFLGLVVRGLYSFFFCLLIFVFGMYSVRSRINNDLKPNQEIMVLQLVIDEVLRENMYSRSYFAFYQCSETRWNKEKLLLKIQRDSLQPMLHPGDKILAYSKLQVIPKKRNPYDFDYKKYLADKNIYRQVYLKKGTYKKLAEIQVSLKRIAFEMRIKLLKSLNEKIESPDVLAVTSALLLGERLYISSELQKSYANAGVIHILAVSGLHIGIIVLLLSFLLQPLKRWRYGSVFKFFLMLFFLWGYAFLAGLSASVVRAVTMFSFISFGIVLQQRSNVFYSIISSALLLVLVNPFYLFDLGFKMSYIAVLSIVILYPYIKKIVKPKNKILKYLWNLSAVSLSAQMGLLPLSLYYFHQFPGLFMVSNLVVLPGLGIILVFGFFILGLSYLKVDFEIMFTVYSWIVNTLNNFISFISEQEYWLLDQIFISKLLLVTFYIVLLLLVRLFTVISLKRIYVLGIAILFFQGVLFYESYKNNKVHEFIIYHQYNKTNISIRIGSKVKFYGTLIGHEDSVVQKYLNGTDVKFATLSSQIPSVFKFKNKSILVIDEMGVYKVPNFQPEYVLLKDSPKFNLDRCIAFLNPKYIIVDGSNDPYLKQRWKMSCAKWNIEFYDISQYGAFHLK
jgi:competence protein ComEC